MFDRQRRIWQIAVDNAGLYKVFQARGVAATSFLELASERPDLRGSLKPEAVIDFVAHGCVYGPATFLSGIRKLRAEEVLELDARYPGSVRLSTKRLPLPLVDSEAVLARIGHLARSLAGRKVSADLTGGADTRLLVCLLRQHGLDPEFAVCGLPNSADVIIAERIASLLGSPLLTNQPDLSALEDELEQCFLAGDGQIDSAFFHIDWRHAQVRLARGVEVIVHGGGGAHFKDFYAFQDFPLYGRSRANFRRYYDLRVCPVELPRHYFTPRGADIASQARERALAAYEPYAGPTNNESYDRVSYFLRAPEFHGGNYATYINLGLDVAAPLLEYENALVGMRLSPWLRFFNGWHRRVLSAHCPTLAALPTTEGYSTSTALRHLVPDTLGYTAHRGDGQSRRRPSGSWGGLCSTGWVLRPLMILCSCRACVPQGRSGKPWTSSRLRAFSPLSSPLPTCGGCMLAACSPPASSCASLQRLTWL